MAASSSGFLKDYTVVNPNFVEDVIKFMDLPSTVQVRRDIERADQKSPLSDEQVESGELTLKERLNALINRVEFIGHLGLVAKVANESDYVLLGQEVKGIQWDIKALRLYLALTCIDIFCEKGELKSYFKEVFSGTFTSEAIKRRLRSSLHLRKADDTEGTLGEIGHFFYSVRNYYTHSGKRFHIKEDIPLTQLATFKSGTKQHKEDQHLGVKEGVKLVELIQSLGLDAAKRRFGWGTD